MPDPVNSNSAITSSRIVASICIFLVTITWLVFGQTIRHGFVNYDDNVYIYKNPDVTAGVTAHGLISAFTRFQADNWHPLTTISHMLDCQFFGLNAGAHHFVNVFFHTIVVVLLFLVFWKMTGALWCSAFVAAVFAIHPLHVESVAWVAERKDVLSGVFFTLTLGAYVHYALQPRSDRYLAMLILFACGLMSKPMLVTLPVVLLLLDYWPLKRVVDLRTVWKLIVEKIPMLALSIGSAIATLLAQREGMAAFEKLPFMWRVTNALVSCVAYASQMIWPVKLTAFYPHPGLLPPWQIFGAITLLIAVTLVAFILRKRRPYLIVGWLWYLVMLAPVIGLIQVGMQARADRYTYLSQIGLYFLTASAIADLSLKWRWRREILSFVAAMVIAALAWQARIQTSYWRNSETLWNHSLAVTFENNFTRFALGEALLSQERVDEAIPHFRAVLARDPDQPAANFQLGLALAKKGEFDLAIEHYRKVLEGGSDTTSVHYELGNVLLRQGQWGDAIREYERALELKPDNTDAETTLANVLLQNGHGEEAIAHYRNILQLEPASALVHYNLAVGLHRAHRISEAILHYKEALAIRPDYPDADYFLGQALLQDGQQEAAKIHLQKQLLKNETSKDPR